MLHSALRSKRQHTGHSPAAHDVQCVVRSKSNTSDIAVHSRKYAIQSMIILRTLQYTVESMQYNALLDVFSFAQMYTHTHTHTHTHKHTQRHTTPHHTARTHTRIHTHHPTITPHTTHHTPHTKHTTHHTRDTVGWQCGGPVSATWRPDPERGGQRIGFGATG
jgi:hypothetical protein